MFNPIIAILHNTALNRWHPIVFDERPLPGPDSPDKPVRHKSQGHHTEGFETREAALESINGPLKEHIPNAKCALEKDFEWDGQDTPAMVVFFVETEKGWQPAF